MSSIKLDNVSKTFIDSSESLNVLHNINLEIEEGELITLFGPNGCGKSTLLNVLSGLIDPDTGGNVLINNRSPKDSKIGFIFQDYSESLFPWKSVLDNIAFPNLLKGDSKKESKRKTQDFLKILDIELPWDNYPYKLSGGQQQTTAILRTLNYQPDVFLLDEPFSSLDFQARLEMREIFLKLWRMNKKTTIFVSHEIEEALYLCDQFIMLSKKPARILHILKNDLPRPRKPSMLKDPEFIKLRNKAIDIFTEEVNG